MLNALSSCWVQGAEEIEHGFARMQRMKTRIFFQVITWSHVKVYSRNRSTQMLLIFILIFTQMDWVLGA
jgi:hypothetical protein